MLHHTLQSLTEATAVGCAVRHAAQGLLRMYHGNTHAATSRPNVRYVEAKKHHRHYALLMTVACHLHVTVGAFIGQSKRLQLEFLALISRCSRHDWVRSGQLPHCCLRLHPMHSMGLLLKYSGLIAEVFLVCVDL